MMRRGRGADGASGASARPVGSARCGQRGLGGRFSLHCSALPGLVSLARGAQIGGLVSRPLIVGFGRARIDRPVRTARGMRRGASHEWLCHLFRRCAYLGLRLVRVSRDADRPSGRSGATGPSYAETVFGLLGAARSVRARDAIYLPLGETGVVADDAVSLTAWAGRSWGTPRRRAPSCGRGPAEPGGRPSRQNQ